MCQVCTLWRRAFRTADNHGQYWGGWHATSTRHAERGITSDGCLKARPPPDRSGRCRRLISRYIQPHQEQYSFYECSIGPPFVYVSFSYTHVQSCNSNFAFSPYVVLPDSYFSFLSLFAYFIPSFCSHLFLPLSLHFSTPYQRLWIHSLKRNGNYMYHLL
jgi:hypothetical protein